MITKSPENKTNFVRNIIYTNSARVSFELLLKYLDFKKDEKILIPAYIGITEREGSGVFDPIKKCNLNYEFYSIDKQFQYNYDEISHIISTNKIKALLVIHYFGFLHCDILKIQKLCKEKNVLLIEDCAHVYGSLYNGISLGDFGDFSFFSIHKVFATNDGGILKINKKSTKLFSNTDNDINIESLKLFVNSDKEKINTIKLNNYNYFVEKLKNIPELKLIFKQIPDGIIPLNLPIVVLNNKREKLYFKLLEYNIPTIALYYRLIDELSPKLYPNSYFLSENILNLPVNQDINFSDIDYISDTILTIMKKL